MATPERTRPWRGLAPAERDAHRRERLLAAALELYGTQGYAQTTVAALCAEANVATRTLYELFGSREALLTALYDELMIELGAAFSAAMDAERDDAVKRIHAGVAATVDYLLGDERRGRIAEFEVVGVSPELERRRRAVLRQFATQLDGEVDRAVDLGLAPKRPRPAMLSFIMAGGVTEALADHLATDPAERQSLEALTDGIAAVWLQVLGLA